MKRKFTVILALALAALLLAACGTSEFALTENTGKKMTITAKNAKPDSFFLSGALTVEDGEQVVLSGELESGCVRVEIIPAPEESSMSTVPELDGEPVLTANLETTDSAAGTLPAGSYLLKATCLEKATGTVQLDVLPAE